MTHFKRLILILLFLHIGLTLKGQVDSTRFKIIEGVTKDFLWDYLSYDKAKEMTDFVNQKFNSGGYDTTLNIDEFTYELTKDLRNVSKDEHINIMRTHVRKFHRNKSKFTRHLFAGIGRIFHKKLKDDFSYGEIKILPGNIGYLEVNDFKGTTKPNKDRIKFKSVMRFFDKTNSIIIDFRANMGGYIVLSNYLTSFFTDNPNAYFISTSYRMVHDTIPNGRDTTYTRKDYIYKSHNFKYMKGKDVYVLTSHSTFSAGVLTTYALKKLSKVEIIGEQTRQGGNGHFGGYSTRYYGAIVPDIKVFDEENNDYTFASVGISPDTYVNADSALSVAYLKAFQKAGADTLKTNGRYYKGRNENEITYKQSRLINLSDYIGDYRKVKIELINNKLYFNYDIWPKSLLVPRSKDNFKTHYFKSVKFIRDEENIISSIQVKWQDNTVETFRLIK